MPLFKRKQESQPAEQQLEPMSQAGGQSPTPVEPPSRPTEQLRNQPHTVADQHISQNPHAANPTLETISAVPQNEQSAFEQSQTKAETSGYIQPPPPAYSQNGNQQAYEAQRQWMVTPLARLGEEPADVDCPYCRQVTRTGVNKNDSSMTIISGVLIGLLCICLACLPCCMGACADVDHYCTKCGKQLTHRPYDGSTQVVANLPQDMVPSQFPGQQQSVAQQQQQPQPQQHSYQQQSQQQQPYQQQPPLINQAK